MNVNAVTSYFPKRNCYTTNRG